jgi:hypothetical protein
MKMERTTPPEAEELELSLFGPGIGECIVVHLGAGNWMVVDSCLNGSGDKAIALEYLDGLGVDVASRVKLVVATHWHDDHIRGLAQVVRRASTAHFACSAALRCEEFLTLIAADEDVKLVEHTSGVSEFAEVLNVLNSREAARYYAGPDYWACDGMRLYFNANPCDVEVDALSPSSHVVTDSHREIALLIPRPGPIRRFPSSSPNDSSVVLLVRTIGLSLLLGADLGKGADYRRGWQAILASSGARPRARCSSYKVAHHGSEDADLDGTWENLLIEDPRAVLTPYARGRTPLPSESDVSRINARTAYAYCTAWPPTKSPPTREPAVDRTLREVVLSRRAIRKCPGQIRIRAPIIGRPDDMLIELFSGAARL